MDPQDEPFLQFQPHRTRVTLHTTVSLAFKRNQVVLYARKHPTNRCCLVSLIIQIPSNSKCSSFLLSLGRGTEDLFFLKLMHSSTGTWPKRTNVRSAWFQVALRALSCMEHRGACSGGMDSTMAMIMDV